MSKLLIIFMLSLLFALLFFCCIPILIQDAKDKKASEGYEGIVAFYLTYGAKTFSGLGFTYGVFGCTLKDYGVRCAVKGQTEEYSTLFKEYEAFNTNFIGDEALLKKLERCVNNHHLKEAINPVEDPEKPMLETGETLIVKYKTGRQIQLSDTEESVTPKHFVKMVIKYFEESALRTGESFVKPIGISVHHEGPSKLTCYDFSLKKKFKGEDDPYFEFKQNYYSYNGELITKKISIFNQIFWERLAAKGVFLLPDFDYIVSGSIINPKEHETDIRYYVDQENGNPYENPFGDRIDTAEENSVAEKESPYHNDGADYHDLFSIVESDDQSKESEEETSTENEEEALKEKEYTVLYYPAGSYVIINEIIDGVSDIFFDEVRVHNS